MIAIIDYGVGNLFSLQSSLKFIGADAEVTNDIAKIKAADRIILPGVGAFADAIRKLRESGMEQVVLEEAANGKPLLGICLGMQLFFHHRLQICFSVAIAYAFITKKLPIPVIKQGREYISRVATQSARSILRTS